MTSLRTFKNDWGFNGMDWDLEQGERPYDKNGIIDASRRMRAEFGSTWIICFAPGPNLQTWIGAGGVLDTLGPNGWDAVGEQLYDLNVSEADNRTAIVNRMTALSNKYGPSKVLLGNKYRADAPGQAVSANSVVDIATTRSALTELRSAGKNIRGSFVWTIQSDSDQAYSWSSSTGVGGWILANP
jgi:chitinase